MRINPFRIKSISSEIPPDGRGLKKVLGPLDLVMLGIGGIVGAGIFALVGEAAAGKDARLGAGPALVISFFLTAVACSFAALCYAEFASISHVAGSAYSYAYATLGELVAWIIGWDLVLEYAVGNVAVAVSWSGYFQDLLRGFGMVIPRWLGTDFRTAFQAAMTNQKNLDAFPHVLGIPIAFNLPAVFIVTAITAVLYIGIKESSRFNNIMVAIYMLVAVVLTGMLPLRPVEGGG